MGFFARFPTKQSHIEQKQAAGSLLFDVLDHPMLYELFPILSRVSIIHLLAEFLEGFFPGSDKELPGFFPLC